MIPILVALSLIAAATLGGLAILRGLTLTEHEGATEAYADELHGITRELRLMRRRPQRRLTPDVLRRAAGRREQR
jgi:hypothetical protein